MNMDPLPALEESLRQSQQIIYTILDAIPVRVFWKDRDLKYLGCNRPFAQDAGFNEPKELIGRDDYGMGWREQAEIYRADDLSVIASGKAKMMIEEPQKTPDGRIIWLLTSKVPLRDATGGISGVLGTYMDITEYRNAKESIRESEEKYRAFFATSKDCVFITSKDGRFVDFNDETPAFFGYRDREEFWAVNIGDLYSNASERQEHIRAIEQSGFVKEYPVDLRKKDGSIIHVLVTSIARKDISGKVIGFQGTIKNITEQRRAEEALRESEERFRGITERISDLIFIVDPEGYLTFVSPSVISILGFPPESYIGKRAGPDITHAEDIVNIEKAVERLKNGSLEEQIEFQMPKSDGSYAVFDGTGTPVFTHGMYAGVQVVARDITERKRAEVALTQSEERYRTLSEASPDQIFIIGRDDIMKYANTAALKLFRLPFDQVIGRPRKYLFPPEIAKSQDASLQKAFETGERVRSEERIKFGEQEFWIDINQVPLKDKAGHVTSVLGIARDITDRKRAEEALKESNERYLSYIKEAAMRLKTPVEVVEHNITTLIKDINAGDINNNQVLLLLQIQVKNMEQIRQNILDLNKTIVDRYGEMSPASKQFLTE